MKLLTFNLLLLASVSAFAGTEKTATRMRRGDEYREAITEAARRASLDPKLVEAVIAVESNYSRRAVSPKGAQGLMQVIPTTQAECGIAEPYHTVNHLMGATECLRKLINRFRGNVKLALAAYNAGTGAVVKYGGIPPYRETREYVKKVLGTYSRLKRQP